MYRAVTRGCVLHARFYRLLLQGNKKTMKIKKLVKQYSLGKGLVPVLRLKMRLSPTGTNFVSNIF